MWQMMFLFEGMFFFRFHVDFQGLNFEFSWCKCPSYVTIEWESREFPCELIKEVELPMISESVIGWWGSILRAIGARVDLDFVKMISILLDVPNTTRNPLRWGMALPTFFPIIKKSKYPLSPVRNEDLFLEIHTSFWG